MTNNEGVNEYMTVHSGIDESNDLSEYIQSFDHPWSVKCIRKRTAVYICLCLVQSITT